MAEQKETIISPGKALKAIRLWEKMSLEQAAALLECEVSLLLDIEEGKKEPEEPLLNRALKLYSALPPDFFSFIIAAQKAEKLLASPGYKLLKAASCLLWFVLDQHQGETE